jgi:hypothetical protein
MLERLASRAGLLIHGQGGYGGPRYIGLPNQVIEQEEEDDTLTLEERIEADQLATADGQAWTPEGARQAQQIIRERKQSALSGDTMAGTLPPLVGSEPRPPTPDPITTRNHSEISALLRAGLKRGDAPL